MFGSIKTAFQNKVFTIAFLYCFVLSTPIFYKAVMIDIIDGEMGFIHFVALSLQYLFCVMVMPRKIADQYKASRE